MRYDRDGFPIPVEFAPPSDGGRTVARQRRPGVGKRIVVAAIIVGGVLPAILAPVAMPRIREAVVMWSLEQAARHELRGDPAAAVADLTRAIAWFGDDVELLCMRAMLRLANRDPAGAIADAEHAMAVSPTSQQPARVRAIARVVANDPAAALADAELVVRLAGEADPEALNHRAYIRALVSRDLPDALADIDAAMAGRGDEPPEFLDTRGFVLHLLGRHVEAIDQLNLAIDGMQRQRRETMLLAGRVDQTELARRLRWFDHSLAVMHHHRGLACRSLGLDDQADEDFETAKKKGFDPSRGVL